LSKPTSVRRLLLLIALCVIASSAPAQQQQPPAPSEQQSSDDEVVRISTNLVTERLFARSLRNCDSSTASGTTQKATDKQKLHNAASEWRSVTHQTLSSARARATSTAPRR